MSAAKKAIVVLALILLFLLISGNAAKAANSISPSLGAGTNRKSYLGRDDLPKGIRNNNPGNLKMTNPQQGWQGSLDRNENTDGVFEQFIYYGYGLRAMLKLMNNKIKNGQNTIRKMIRIWAPSSENNTEAYISFVEQNTGIAQNQTLYPKDYDQFYSIAKAIEFHENGILVMTEEDFKKAFKLI